MSILLSDKYEARKAEVNARFDRVENVGVRVTP